MSTLPHLMTELRQAGVRVWSEGEQLRYRAPHGALTPALLEKLKTRKSDVLEFLGQARAQTEALPLGPVPRDGATPISLAQHRLWVLDRIEGPSPTYNIPLALRLKGHLNVSALHKSLEHILQRHESLRTTFHGHADSGYVVIVPDCRLPWRVVDLQHLPADEGLEEARSQAREEALRPFDLSSAPLIRSTLWQLGPDDQVLMMATHHIVSDGRSIEILAEELSAFYNAPIAGSTAALPPLSIQYADFAWHQRQWLTDTALQNQLSYWQQRLSGLAPLLDIPSDRPRPPIFSSAGATVRSVLSPELTGRVKELARSCGSTPYTVLSATAAALLGRYTDRDDIAIACPVSHRTRPELDSIIGFLINTLVLRFDLSGNPSFRELLRRARTVVTDAFANQDAPFEKVVETLRSERNPSYPPLVQFSMAMLDAKNARLHLPGLQTEPFDFGNPIARFDISLEMYEHEHSIEIFWIHRSELFERDTIARMAQHFLNLIEAATHDPEKPIQELDMLDAAERHLLLHHFNDTERPYPREATIDQLFEEQAAATPDATGAQFRDQKLTYRQLNARANQLAWRLRAFGAGVGTTVALLMERSLDLPTALLAVLKAGAAFVPLDPQDPLERLDDVLNDVQPVVILSQDHLADRLPVSLTHVLCLDSEWAEIAQERTDNLPRESAPEDVAYIMYTSGSTGRPKGIVVPHRAVIRLVKEANYVSLSPQETILQLAPITFDASTFEIWGALLNGGRLAIMPPGMPTLDDLGSALQRHGVTTLWLTAGLFHLMVDERPYALLAVRQLLAGGDVLSPDHVRRLLQAAGGRLTLINGYGPTETTTFACCHAMTSPDDAGTTVPIGRPVSNTRVYVLDRQRNPVPIGVEGDLYIGGDGLADGYLNAAEMTEARFVADPFDARPARRMYRTGDRARWIRDGKLEFLGRRDQQVKIRGFRIELAEIEAALSAHPAVKQAAVVAVADGLEKRLAAYITPLAGAPSVSKVQQYLGRRLPDYMLPDTVTALDDLPLTTNGKVDRAALCRLHTAPEPAASYEPPQNEIESQLADIWAGVLGVDRVGRRDGFFELGGHSLLAAQIIGRVYDAFGVLLPIRLLFDEGTVEAMAEALKETPEVAHAATAAKLRAQINDMDSSQIHQLLKRKISASPCPIPSDSH